MIDVLKACYVLWFFVAILLPRNGVWFDFAVFAWGYAATRLGAGYVLYWAEKLQDPREEELRKYLCYRSGLVNEQALMPEVQQRLREDRSLVVFFAILVGICILRTF